MPIPSLITEFIQPIKSKKNKSIIVKELDLCNERLKYTNILGHLYPGSQFKGYQKCGSNSYEVLVDIQVCYCCYLGNKCNTNNNNYDGYIGCQYKPKYPKWLFKY